MNRILKALLKTIASIILGVAFALLMNTFPIAMAVLLVTTLVTTLFFSFYNEEE